MTMCGSGMYAFILGVGFSWFFFGYCVDFFRDGKNLYLVTLTYFLVWQSNFNAVALATIVCFGIFGCYFKLSRWKDYLRLFLCVLLLILYDIVNMAVHLDALRLSDFSAGFLGDMSKERIVLSTAPFGGFLYRSIQYAKYGGDLCCGFMQFGVFAIFWYYVVNGWRERSVHFKVRASIILIATVVGYAIGIRFNWGAVFNATHAFFQFPIRYFILLYGFVIVVLSKVIKVEPYPLIMLVLCVLDILVSNPLSVGVSSGEMDFVFQRIVYAEYAGSNFVRGIDVYDEYGKAIHAESGATYSFVNEYNGLSVDCSSNAEGDVLTLPKLFYKGYQAYGKDDQTFYVSSGYSNYCKVDIGDYQGTLRLKYEVPKIVMACFCLQIACLLSVIYNIEEGWWNRAKAKRK